MNRFCRERRSNFLPHPGWIAAINEWPCGLPSGKDLWSPLRWGNLGRICIANHNKVENREISAIKARQSTAMSHTWGPIVMFNNHNDSRFRGDYALDGTNLMVHSFEGLVMCQVDKSWNSCPQAFKRMHNSNVMTPEIDSCQIRAPT